MSPQTFDKVAVLYEGRQIYFGPIDCARKYFTDLGYICPDRQTTADFLTSLTTPAERIIQPGLENSIPQTAEDLAIAWQNSSLFKDIMNEIIHFEEQHPVGGPAVATFKASRKAEKASLM